MRTRRTFTREFKVQAVRLVTAQGLTEAARRLDITDGLLRRWKQALEAEAGRAFPGHGRLCPVRAGAAAGRPRPADAGRPAAQPV